MSSLNKIKKAVRELSASLTAATKRADASDLVSLDQWLVGMERDIAAIRLNIAIKQSKVKPGDLSGISARALAERRVPA